MGNRSGGEAPQTAEERRLFGADLAPLVSHDVVHQFLEDAKKEFSRKYSMPPTVCYVVCEYLTCFSHTLSQSTTSYERLVLAHLVACCLWGIALRRNSVLLKFLKKQEWLNPSKSNTQSMKRWSSVLSIFLFLFICMHPSRTTQIFSLSWRCVKLFLTAPNINSHSMFAVVSCFLFYEDAVVSTRPVLCSTHHR